MKARNGSIQRKGTRFYLVVRVHGRQKWVALKTDELAVARERVNEFTTSLTSQDEEEWLAHLVSVGRAAEERLARLRGCPETLDWGGLLQIHLAKNPSCCEDSTNAVKRWFSLLKEQVGGLPPSAVDAATAAKAAATLAEKYVSCRRMIGFFRRCWAEAGLDPSIWVLDAAMRKHINERGESQEFYRRFTTDEIRRIYRELRESAPDLADMVAIGYMTGLRLSDVAELDASEVVDGSATLRIVPNKTRKRKSRPLTIPLVHEAAKIVDVRLKQVSPQEDGTSAAPFGVNKTTGGRFLFPESARHRPSRKLCAAFAGCGLTKNGCARASFHSLRATFISLMDEAGISPYITDSITGHGGGGMHARYTQPSVESLRASLLAAIPPLL